MPADRGSAYKSLGGINMSKKSVVITGVAALVGGIVIGSAGSASSDVPAAEPQVKTVTKTRTVTDRVEVTPQVCLTALDLGATIGGKAGDFGGLFVQMLDVNAKWPGLMKRTLQAGMTMDAPAVQDITDEVKGMNSDMTGINGDLSDLNGELTPLVRRFKNARARCEALS